MPACPAQAGVRLGIPSRRTCSEATRTPQEGRIPQSNEPRLSSMFIEERNLCAGAAERAHWKSQAASYSRLDSWRQVPVAEHDFSCCESLFGGELS